MAYTFSNPDLSDNSLHTFSTLNHPLGESALEPLQRALQRGEVATRDLWLLERDGKAQAALRLQPYPGQPDWRLGTLRTAPDISDDDASVLFTRLRELSGGGAPIHIVYHDSSARDFGALPFCYGWQGSEDYSITYRTDLSGRDDLEPDPAAVTLEPDTLFSNAFRHFYEPIWRAKENPSDKRTLDESLSTLHAFAERDAGQLYTLHDGSTPVGMGIVTHSSGAGEHAAGINMLGVSHDYRKRGWGKRLHRHLMWAAKARSPIYVGNTDSTNVAMQRLFEVNGCTPLRRDWELEPA